MAAAAAEILSPIEGLSVVRYVTKKVDEQREARLTYTWGFASFAKGPLKL